jgi:adenylate cyclase
VWSAQVDGTGSALINFSGPPGNYENGQYVSLIDVLNGTVASDRIKGSIVLVGAYNLSGVHDEQLVTTSAGSNGTLSMAGVELHANVVQMFGVSVTQTLLSREPPVGIFLSILALALLLAVLVARLSVIRGLLMTIGALIVFTLAMAYLAGNNRFVPDIFHPLLAMALTYTGVTAYRVLYEDRERRKVTSLFGQYLKPEIVTQLAKTRGGVADIMRGGERRDITLLFVDIRGFTSMSESMSAHDVTDVVQMYLDHLSGIIFTWDGTIDKYVGDEIVAFWNAPRTQDNHALLAVRCAYDLINRAPELQQKLLAKGLPPIRWGIGVNTGEAVVGMMGSRSRLQYTALGDTVNTTARFCASAPAFHLLIGQPTYEACKDYIAVDLVPGVQLKGKSAETFRIYQVMAIRETPTSPWVQFPTDMASQAHQGFAQQFTQKSILAAANAESTDILVGAEAQEALAGRAAIQAPPPGE